MTRLTWHDGADNPNQVPDWCATPTTVPNTRPGRSGRNSAKPESSNRWETVGDALDNAVVESFFATLQTELLDRCRWETRQQLSVAIFEYIEGWYNPERRHSHNNQQSPVNYRHQQELVA